MLPYSGIPALPKNIEDMHNQLVTLGLNDVEAITKRIQKCEAWVASVEETEQTGNPVEYHNALALPAVSCTVNLEPIQDLHGYDKPWVGGAGKNLVNINSFTDVSDVSHTVNNNTINISAVNKTYAACNYGGSSNLKFEAGTYYIKGNLLSATDLSYVRLAFRDSSNTIVAGIYLSTLGNFASSITIDVPCYFSIMISGSTALSNSISVDELIISTTDVPFEPWENICPISGRTESTVTVSDGDETSADFTISLGQTVYGGSVDFTTGEASVTWAAESFDGSSSAGWSYVSDYGTVSRFDCTSVVGKVGGNVISNYLKGGNDASIIPNEDHVYLHGGYGYLIICVETSRLATKDVTGLMSYLASNNLQVCYELATPLTLTLTPTEVQMLKGYNSVSSEDGDITITTYTGDPWEAVTRAIKKVTKKTANKKSKKGGK
jgi:hypothetical protein